MKSIKPGRGPSLMGVIGAMAAAVFGVLWMVFAASMDAPPVFLLFGLVFIGMAVAIGVYNFANATRKDRFSLFDITDEHEEPDPLNQRFGGRPSAQADGGSRFCPYCGTPAAQAFAFCTKCGKQLP